MPLTHTQYLHEVQMFWAQGLILNGYSEPESIALEEFGPRIPAYPNEEQGCEL